jgi:hypothetical protein
VLFCVAMPRSGKQVHWARKLEQNFVVDLIDSRGGPLSRTCRGELPMPDEGALIIVRPPRHVAPAAGATGGEP